MGYALQTLWYERRRYLPGILAVAFSGLLIAMQVGLLMGLIGVVSVPIINSKAQIWVMYPDTPACDLARPLPNYWLDRLWMQPEIAQADEYVQGFSYWKTNTGATVLIVVVGVDLSDDSLGPIAKLTPQQRDLLTEPLAVILDRKDAGRLEVDAVSDTGEVRGQTVRNVGFVQGMGAITGPYVLCSIPTARRLLGMRDDQASYLLATCHEPEQVPLVIERLREFPKISVHTSEAFSERSKSHWIQKTKAGIALGFAALLGLAVGASITSQTLYSATAASLRELAVLQALGIPRWRMHLFVLWQSLFVGVVGLAIGLTCTFLLADLARSVGTPVALDNTILIGTSVVTLTMAMLSGLFALRSLSGVEPAELLR